MRSFNQTSNRVVDKRGIVVLQDKDCLNATRQLMSNAESRRNIPNNDPDNQSARGDAPQEPENEVSPTPSQPPNESAHRRREFQELPGARTREFIDKQEQLGENASVEEDRELLLEYEIADVLPRIAALQEKSEEEQNAQRMRGYNWMRRREALGLTVEEVAEKVGISHFELFWTEHGLFAPGGMPEEIAHKLDAILPPEESDPSDT